jgi:hypothetical protein
MNECVKIFYFQEKELLGHCLAAVDIFVKETIGGISTYWGTLYKVIGDKFYINGHQ